ncbi:MAG TPA: hypothetical protein PK798_02965 [Flavobacteriales bacterium]|nr:hypothetical protein [Flavobacteriales bacterium]HRJ37721.1 hypothetical protein [Flavobacteriales bacterium]
MEKYNETYIKNYFLSRNWKISREGNLFFYLKPPNELDFPQDFLLEIPKENGNKESFDNYIRRLISDLSEMLPYDSNVDDLKILFSKEHSILRYRVFDSENKDGTISFQKHIDSLEGFKKVLSQAVTFVSTSKPIFGDAKFEVESYLNRCRSLQTEKGSYITKIEIPNDKIYSAISVLETTEINNKLFDVIEYINKEIFETKSKIKLNENYIQDHKEFINFELFHSLKDIYAKTNINNIEYQLSSNSAFRKVETNRVQPKMKFFNSYLKDLKNLLLDVVPLEAVGYIKRLSSPAPKHSKKNEVLIDAEIGNNKETIKIILRSEEYIEAIEAHKNEWPIKIKGKARESKKILTINELEDFEILKK